VEQAEALLRNDGFEVVRDPDTASTKPEGEVLRQNPPPGTSLERGATVTLVYSSPEAKAVPDVANQTAGTAAATLVRAGFEVVEASEPSDTVEAGRVTRTDPAAGTMLKVGEKVTLYTSSGRGQVPVPTVLTLLADSAVRVLEQAGFTVAARQQDVPPGSPNVGRVIDQSPAPNTLLARGSVVTITVGQATTTTTTAPPAPTTTVPPATTVVAPTTTKKD
jgi:eukaryotic-like serine/threonine-protein kinase